MNKKFIVHEDGSLEQEKKNDLIKWAQSSKEFALNNDEKILLSEKIKLPKHRVIFYLGVYLGLRRGEIAQARKDWFKLEKFVLNGREQSLMTINIPYRTRDIRNPKLWWKAKTKQSERTAILFDEVVSRELWVYYNLNPKGVYCSVDYIYKVVANPNIKYSFCSFLGRKLYPHALRSTYVFSLKELGLDDNQIKYMLGWSDVRTMNNYFKDTRNGLLATIKNKFGEVGK